MRYFEAKEHMDLWKIIFFHNFQDEKNTRPYTIAELNEHAKTRKIKLTFTEPTAELKGNVPENTILIHIPGAKLCTKDPDGKDVVSRFFGGYNNANETYAEYILEEWRADVYVPDNEVDKESNYSPLPCKPGRINPRGRYQQGRGGSVLYFPDKKEFRKNPTCAPENSPCDTLDQHLCSIASTTSIGRRLYQEIVLHNCKKHPLLASVAACCLALVVGCALTRNVNISAILSSSAGRGV